MPEVGGRVDWHAGDHEQTMVALGLWILVLVLMVWEKPRNKIRDLEAKHRKRVEEETRGNTKGLENGNNGTEPNRDR